MYKFSLLLGLLFLTFSSIAQSNRISESKESMNEGTFNALVIQFPNAEDKLALSVWKNYIKGYGGKAKKSRKAKEYLSKGVVIADVNNSDPISVYARVLEKSEGSEVIVWFAMGEFFVSSGSFPKDYTAAQKFLEDYALEVAKRLVNDELDEEEKKFGKMEKSMKKLKKKNDGYHKNIEKAKAAIAKAEREIEKNEREQKEQKSVMEDQSKKIQAIKEKLSEM